MSFFNFKKEIAEISVMKLNNNVFLVTQIRQIRDMFLNYFELTHF